MKASKIKNRVLEVCNFSVVEENDIELVLEVECFSDVKAILDREDLGYVEAEASVDGYFLTFEI